MFNGEFNTNLHGSVFEMSSSKIIQWVEDHVIATVFNLWPTKRFQFLTLMHV